MTPSPTPDEYGMAREAFETLPLYKAALRLATDAHRITANFPADEKSGLGGTFKKLADAPATLAAHADAADTPAEALTYLRKCEPNFRELVATALLAHRLDILSRTELRRFRLHVARLRRMVQEEADAWQAAAEEQRRDEEIAQAEAQAEATRSDHDFDPRDQQAIQRELDFEDVDAIGLTHNAPPTLMFNGQPIPQHHPRRQRRPAWTRWFNFSRAA